MYSFQTNYTGWFILGFIVVGFIFGFLCLSLADKKGYNTYAHFWLGFFLWIAGLLYIIGLPIKASESTTQPVQAPIQKTTIPPSFHMSKQNNQSSAGLIGLKLEYIHGSRTAFNEKVHSLLDNGYTKEDLYSCCVDDHMKQWIDRAITNN